MAILENCTEREKKLLGIGVVMGLCIFYLAIRSPEVVVMPQPTQTVSAPAVATVTAVAAPEPVMMAANISPVTRSPVEYSPQTRDALRLQTGDLEIGRLNIYIDPETRCQYLRPIYREGFTPRLRKDGHPWCD